MISKNADNFLKFKPCRKKKQAYMKEENMEFVLSQQATDKLDEKISNLNTATSEIETEDNKEKPQGRFNCRVKSDSHRSTIHLPSTH